MIIEAFRLSMFHRVLKILKDSILFKYVMTLKCMIYEKGQLYSCTVRNSLINVFSLQIYSFCHTFDVYGQNVQTSMANGQ